MTPPNRGVSSVHYRFLPRRTRVRESLELQESASAWRFWEADGLSRKGIHALSLVGDEQHLTVLNTHPSVGLRLRVLSGRPPRTDCLAHRGREALRRPLADHRRRGT